MYSDGVRQDLKYTLYLDRSTLWRKKRETNNDLVEKKGYKTQRVYYVIM